MGAGQQGTLVKRVILFLNYWIFGTRDTQGRRRLFGLRQAWETATIIAALNKGDD